jgi:hypothetical protein
MSMSSFKDLSIVDNFYQTSSYFPMPTVMISTLAEDGSTSVGSYSLCFPYYIAGKGYYAMVLEARNSSNTAQHVAGIARYTSGEATPAWAGAVSGILSYGTVIPLILAGIAVWIRQKTPFLFLSGFLMFLFSALGPATGNFDLIFYISMYGEVLMVLFFYLYARFRAARQEV